MPRFSIFSASGSLLDVVVGQDLESAILANLINLAFLARLADECGVVVSAVHFRAMPKNALDDAYLRITLMGRGWRELSGFRQVMLACYDGASSWALLNDKKLTRRCWYLDVLHQAGLCDAQIGHGLAAGLLQGPEWLVVMRAGDCVVLQDRASFDSGVSVLSCVSCAVDVDGLAARLRHQSLNFCWEYHALPF